MHYNAPVRVGEGICLRHVYIASCCSQVKFLYDPGGWIFHTIWKMSAVQFFNLIVVEQWRRLTDGSLVCFSGAAAACENHAIAWMLAAWPRPWKLRKAGFELVRHWTGAWFYLGSHAALFCPVNLWLSFLELMRFQDSLQDLKYEMPLGQDNKEAANDAAVAYRHWK